MEDNEPKGSTNYLMVFMLTVTALALSMGGQFLAQMSTDTRKYSWIVAAVMWGSIILFVSFADGYYRKKRIPLPALLSLMETTVVVGIIAAAHFYPMYPNQLMITTAVMFVYTSIRMCMTKHPYLRQKKQIVYSDDPVAKEIGREGSSQKKVIVKDFNKFKDQVIDKMRENGELPGFGDKKMPFQVDTPAGDPGVIGIKMDSGFSSMEEMYEMMQEASKTEVADFVYDKVETLGEKPDSGADLIEELLYLQQSNPDAKIEAEEREVRSRELWGELQVQKKIQKQKEEELEELSPDDIEFYEPRWEDDKSEAKKKELAEALEEISITGQEEEQPESEEERLEDQSGDLMMDVMLSSMSEDDAVRTVNGSYETKDESIELDTREYDSDIEAEDGGFEEHVEDTADNERVDQGMPVSGLVIEPDWEPEYDSDSETEDGGFEEHVEDTADDERVVQGMPVSGLVIEPDWEAEVKPKAEPEKSDKSKPALPLYQTRTELMVRQEQAPEQPVDKEPSDSPHEMTPTEKGEEQAAKKQWHSKSIEPPKPATEKPGEKPSYAAPVLKPDSMISGKDLFSKRFPKKPDAVIQPKNGDIGKTGISFKKPQIPTRPDPKGSAAGGRISGMIKSSELFASIKQNKGKKAPPPSQPKRRPRPPTTIKKAVGRKLGPVKLSEIFSKNNKTNGGK